MNACTSSVLDVAGKHRGVRALKHRPVGSTRCLGCLCSNTPTHPVALHRHTMTDASAASAAPTSVVTPASPGPSRSAAYRLRKAAGDAIRSRRTSAQLDALEAKPTDQRTPADNRALRDRRKNTHRRRQRQQQQEAEPAPPTSLVARDHPQGQSNSKHGIECVHERASLPDC